MQQLTILNTREIKQLKELLIQQFGSAPEEDYAYLKNRKNRIFIVSREIDKVDWQHLIIDRVGLYFGELYDRSFRLSKEGALIVGLAARKKKIKLNNVVQLTKEETRLYFQGQNMEKDLGPQARFVLLEHDRDFLGCAKYKERKILNFLPKIHRGEVII